MKPTSPKTLQVIKCVLEYGFVSQRMIMRKTGISLGQVNKVFQWLEENAFIEKTRKVHRKAVPKELGAVRYHLVNPTGLLRAVSLFRSMKKNLLLEANLDLPKEEVIGYLEEKDIVFCLETALEKYDSYFRGDRICCYFSVREKIESIEKDLRTVRYGLTKVGFYAWDLKGQEILDPLNSVDRYTTKVQTIIDLFCDQKAHYTKELVKDLWGAGL